METITYSLKRNQNNSDNYYKDIKSFTNEVLSEFESFENSIIMDINSYIKEKSTDKMRSYEECVFEFLMLGTFWRTYGHRALDLDEKPQKLLENLASMRNENESAKEDIDFIRGVLMTLFLSHDTANSPDLTIYNFDKLLKYLKATGDYSQEVKRLAIWKDFLETKTPEISSEYLANAFLFADWFEYRSKITLGEHTVDVNKFLTQKHQEHLFREDVIFCGRKEVEYHLNMVGAEIMNRAFRKEFEKRSRKALLLPGCMRLTAGTKCKAQNTNLGSKCIGCSKSCNVHCLTNMGKEYGFEVYVISHESSALSKSTREDRDELGIVGVACVLNLVLGGWKAESLGVPAQCVLLDYSSCKNHWDSEGFPTSINLNQLMQLLNIEKSEINDHVKPVAVCN